MVSRMARPKRTLLLASALALLTAPGCMVVKPVVSTGVSLGATAVKTTGAVTGAAVRAAIPDGAEAPRTDSNESR